MKKKSFILMGLLMCFFLAACGTKNANTSDTSKNTEKFAEETEDKDEKKEEETKEDEQKAEGEDAQEESPESENKEEEKQEEEKIYNIGESALLKDWEVTVTNMQIVESIAADYGSFSPNEEGDRFIQVFVTATNNGKEADRFLPSFVMGEDVQAKVFFGDGYEFSATNLLGYSNELHDATINPLSSQSGEIAFEVPETVHASADELQLHFISGNDVVKFKIR